MWVTDTAVIDANVLEQVKQGWVSLTFSVNALNHLLSNSVFLLSDSKIM